MYLSGKNYLYMNFGKALKTVRLVKGLSQKEAAGLLHMDDRTRLCCMNLVGSQIFPIPFRPQATFTDLGAAI
jgi:hypothetical protein